MSQLAATMRTRAPFCMGAILALSGCAADYLNHYDSVTLAAGDANRANSLAQTVDPFNPNSQNTHIEGDGQRSAAVVAQYRGPPVMGAAGADRASGGGGNGYKGNCPTPDKLAADDKPCGGRAASERPGGAMGP